MQKCGYQKPLGHNFPESKLKKQLFPSKKEPMNEHAVVPIVWFVGLCLDCFYGPRDHP